MAKVGELYITVKIRKWAKPLIIFCVLCRLPIPDFAFKVSKTVEPIK